MGNRKKKISGMKKTILFQVYVLKSVLGESVCVGVSLIAVKIEK